jgi:hemoglobin-like flavoprotein
MTPEQNQLVQQSWAAVEPIADQAAVLFYDRLFVLDPSLRALFTAADMAGQRRKLMQMLGVAVHGLDRLEQLVPALEALGRRHAGYRVDEAQYATVGEALLWTLEQGLGAAFTPAVRDAWADTYDLVATVMKRAAASDVLSTPFRTTG